MFRFPKFVLSMGAVFVIGLVLSAPRTVRAVAAALVQVTNTASNPVVTQGVGQQAAQQVELECVQANYDPASQTGQGDCVLVSPEKNIQSAAYVVPQDQSLVITAVDINPWNECAQGNYPVYLNISVPSSSAPIARRWVFGVGSAPQPLGQSATVHFTYPSGLVFAPQSTLTTYADKCPYYLNLYGYLTTN
jgi:hypothetical protein